MGTKWRLLTFLVGLFFLGCLVSPLALYLAIPRAVMDLMVFAVFLFGAVFVFVVIGIIRDTLTFLKLVK